MVLLIPRLVPCRELACCVTPPQYDPDRSHLLKVRFGEQPPVEVLIDDDPRPCRSVGAASRNRWILSRWSILDCRQPRDTQLQRMGVKGGESYSLTTPPTISGYQRDDVRTRRGFPQISSLGVG